MSHLDIDAIEARANAATPGPWIDAWLGVRENLGDIEAELRIDNGSGKTVIGSETKDMDFISCAREDIPALISRVRELEALVVLQDAVIRDFTGASENASEILIRATDAIRGCSKEWMP